LRKRKVGESTTVSSQVWIQDVEVDAININHEKDHGVLGDGKEAGDLRFRDKHNDLLANAVKQPGKAHNALHCVAEVRILKGTRHESFHSAMTVVEVSHGVAE
jgi:hypothetical protein